jgi:quercetin dioxygenase-like cupin family protein
MADAFEYVRTVDQAAIDELGPEGRYSQKLIDANSGGRNAAVGYIRTPPGGGSPRGLHTHEWEQIFYVLEGVMRVEVDGQERDVTAGSLVVFPAHLPHRNWNATDEITVHLAINAPLPPAKPARPESADVTTN